MILKFSLITNQILHTYFVKKNRAGKMVVAGAEHDHSLQRQVKRG